MERLVDGKSNGGRIPSWNDDDGIEGPIGSIEQGGTIRARKETDGSCVLLEVVVVEPDSRFCCVECRGERSMVDMDRLERQRQVVTSKGEPLTVIGYNKPFKLRGKGTKSKLLIE